MAPKLRPIEEEEGIRDAVFRWLDRELMTGKYDFSREELLNFRHKGERIPLLDTGRGIRNPASFRATLSVMSGAKDNQYEDEILDTGEFVYSLAAGDSPDNRKLLVAYESQVEFVYFNSERPGFYVPYFPMRVTAFDVSAHQILMVENQSSERGSDPGHLALDLRRYSERTSKVRLHQRQFRAQVLSAYTDHCAICRLRYPQLLDAAHITADRDGTGYATVDNGLSLCKIHHQAYDSNLLGISGDRKVAIHPRLLSDSDGPMLRHGLQAMHESEIHVPSVRQHQPDADRLQERFQQFRESIV